MQTLRMDTALREFAAPDTGARPFDQAVSPAVGSWPNTAGLTVAIVLAMSQVVIDCLRLFK